MRSASKSAAQSIRLPDGLWREKEAGTTGPVETNAAAERVYLEIQSCHRTTISSVRSKRAQCRSAMISRKSASLLFVESENLITKPVPGSPGIVAGDHIRKLQPILASERDSLHVSFPICLIGSVRNFSDRGNEPTIHRADVDIQRTTAKRPGAP